MTIWVRSWRPNPCSYGVTGTTKVEVVGDEPVSPKPYGPAHFDDLNRSSPIGTDRTRNGKHANRVRYRTGEPISLNMKPDPRRRAPPLGGYLGGPVAVKN
jgi:hypothetical protein